MTVAVTNTKHVYNGNGSTVEWPYTFPILAASDILLYKIDADDVITQITSNFSINTNTNVVTYPVDTGLTPEVATGEKFIVMRSTTQTQETDLTDVGPLPSSSIEAGLDKNLMIIQELQEQLSRCYKSPIDETVSATDLSAFLAAVSGVFPPWSTGTYAELLAISAAAPTVKRWGFATDMNGGQGQVCFYVANTAVGDQGWLLIPTSYVTAPGSF